MVSETVRDLIERQRTLVKDHQPISTFQELIASGTSLPSTAIVTCADPRCIPENIFKLATGEAIVIRNAGANTRQAIYPILAIDSIISIKDILVIKHTDCGATVFRDDAIKTGLKERSRGSESEIDNMDFGEITRPLEDSAKNDVAFLKDSTFIRSELKSKIHGFVYDLKTGELKQVTQ